MTANASPLRRARPLFAFASVAAIAVAPTLVAGCGSHGGNPGAVTSPPVHRVTGQSDFISAPLGGGARNGGATAGASDKGAPGTTPAAPPTVGSTARKVEETDLYRLDGDRLYYLNGYRGLMVFDVSVVDHPKFLGRSPIYGSPVEMIVRNGIASVVVADWYGAMDDGSPFHGSIVRGIDARDPSNIKITGEAKLGGWVRDTRVVGDVLYAVSEDNGYSYGWDEGYYGGGPVGSSGGSTGPKLIVAAVGFKDGAIKSTGWKEFPGYNGVFNVTPFAIMLAHEIPLDPSNPYGGSSDKTELQYIDISDPSGTIALRGKIEVHGRVQGWGADNGRWNLDFADERYAHTIGCGNGYCGGTGSKYVLATVDFTNPDAPKLASELDIPASGWSPAARFDGGRMYLSPSDAYYSSPGPHITPIQVYDLANPAAPRLAGEASIEGQVWNFIPSGNKLFALGNDYTGGSYGGSKVTLRYLDVTDPSRPVVLGTSSFGDGWAWTPAAGTFKAFTKDDKQGLVVLPFSGWSDKDGTYNNGVQLIQFDATSIATAGAAHTKGWVERGIFVKNRLVSLSDLSLSVVDYSDRSSPKVIEELTLARNVVNAQPNGKTISQLSSDWWGNDLATSEYRVLPIENADEIKSQEALSSVKIDGVNARVFHNGDFAYVVSNLHRKVDCAYGGAPKSCDGWTQQVQIVDLSGGKAVLRGKVELPRFDGYWYGWEWGWYGCWWWDWYDGESVVQVEGDALAFRRWIPGTYGPDGKYHYEEARNALFVVDLKNPDAPSVASTTITDDVDAWWGNMKAVGNTLYTTHYEWVEKPPTTGGGGSISYVKYYLDRIDLTDRAHPSIGSKINVPGVLVGASETDPSLLYTIDYRWYDDKPGDELSVVKVDGDKAYLQGSLRLDGWTGRVIVKGNTAYLSAERYTYAGDTYTGPRVQLHQIDLRVPSAPVDLPSAESKGWGWLLGVEGDRAIITSGWGQQGIDVYQLGAGKAPRFDQFVRTRGWWASSLSRQDDQLFLSSGYWGVQTINLSGR